jgi:hypothetical protein
MIVQAQLDITLEQAEKIRALTAELGSTPYLGETVKPDGTTCEAGEIGFLRIVFILDGVMRLYTIRGDGLARYSEDILAAHIHPEQ